MRTLGSPGNKQTYVAGSSLLPEYRGERFFPSLSIIPTSPA